MKNTPTILCTKKLTLRPLNQVDASLIAVYIDSVIAHNIIDIPYPCSVNWAKDWITEAHEQTKRGEGYYFAIELEEGDEGKRFIGTIYLKKIEHQRAAMTLWFGKDYRQQGYGSKVIRCVIEFGFQKLGLNRIHAGYLTHNEASKHLMESVGMTYEGTYRQHFFKNGEFYDLGMYAILRSEWMNNTSTGDIPHNIN